MSTDIHRLLDEAFAGTEMTPDAQDLKEEIRANLVARVAELESSGRSSTDAAQLAIAELGDVRELLGEVPASASTTESSSALYLRHRVRPKTGYVVRVVVWTLAATLGLTLATLGATALLPLPIGPIIGLLGVAATGLGLVVGDSLAQETTTNHPMPSERVGGYALATFLAVYGLGFTGIVALGAMPVWGIVFAALGVIAAIILFAFLGASQTNRKKAWVRNAHHSGFAGETSNRFEEEPETAARFGMYTAVIWIVTFALIVVLGFTVGWWWAPLAFVGGLAAMLLLLARMMFGPRKDA